jgi:hypothetical protein
MFQKGAFTSTLTTLGQHSSSLTKRAGTVAQMELLNGERSSIVTPRSRKRLTMGAW